MKKKILALIISLTMVMGTFSVALAVPSDVVGTPYEESVERLFDLGIVIAYPDGTYGPNDNITREEYSVIAIKTKQLEERANNRKGDTVFGDVEANSWSTGYVNVAEEEKLIVGIGPVNGVNSFGPKLNLTYEQAVAIVLRAIGYEPEVADKGGWPDGYLAVASEVGLLDGINGTKGMLATRGMVAELTYNALEIPNMIRVGSDYIVSGTQGTDEVYLFNELHMINEAAASGNWGNIDEDTFALGGITGGNNIATAANVKTLVDAHATLGPKYTVVDDLAGKLTFTENPGNVDGVALTATTSSNVGTVTPTNVTLGTIGVAPSSGTAQVNTLTISGPATAAGEIKVIFDDGDEFVKTVAVDNGDTGTVVAGNIATEFAGLNGWTVTSAGNIVTFTADAPAADKTVTIKVVEN